MSDPGSHPLLIIDDSEAGRYASFRNLTKAGYKVAEAKSCREGLKAIAELYPALVLLDVQLPDGNGYELCKKLKSDPANAKLPILMTSASFVQAHDKAFGLDCGADGYLTTPIDSLELVATVKALLRVREMEDKLVRSQKIFQTLADSVPAMVWMSGADKLCYYFNKAWLDFTGRTLEREYGEGWIENVHRDDRDECLKTYAASFNQQKPFERSYRLKRHDGHYRWILDRGEPHFELDGAFKGYTGASIDVHDKLVAERKLKDSEERFELAMQGMNDGLWDWDIPSNTVYYSARYKAMLGYGANEFPNTEDAWVGRMHEDDRERVRENTRKFLNGELLHYKNIYRILHKDNAWRWILSRAAAVRDSEGKAKRMVGAITDITELKELEYALREAYMKAEAANNAKTEFLANMSHEIRTPMNAIIGLSNIMTTTPLSERQKEFMTTLQLSAESLLSLINDMLDISKIEDNMIELEHIAFSLKELVDRVISIVSVKANEKHLQLKVHFDAGIQDQFMGDPHRIQQVLVNLMTNGIKFTPVGEVALKVEQKATGVRGEYKVTFQISDTGIGIPKEKHYSIFKKFTQADSSITRKYGGTGLGLSISKSLIERMKGNIHLSSKVGKGSVFTVNLTLKAEGGDTGGHSIPSQEAVNEKARDNANRKRILLVEDYPANILVATIMLSEAGYDYDVATNGKDALQKMQEHRYDAVLMDVQMQDMDGYETTRRIRAWEMKENRLPNFIIAMTAHALSGDREKCLKAGMNDYIPKPFNPMDLKSKLTAYLEKNTAA